MNFRKFGSVHITVVVGLIAVAVLVLMLVLGGRYHANQGMTGSLRDTSYVCFCEYDDGITLKFYDMGCPTWKNVGSKPPTFSSSLPISELTSKDCFRMGVEV